MVYRPPRGAGALTPADDVMERNYADTPETNHSSDDLRPDVEYVGLRVDGTAVVLNLTDRRQLSPDGASTSPGTVQLA